MLEATFCYRHFLTLPSMVLDYDGADPRKFLDRLWIVYDYLGMSFMFNIYASFQMQRALRPVLNSFSLPKYYSEATMAFTDMPEELYVPSAKSNEVSYFSFTFFVEFLKDFKI